MNTTEMERRLIALEREVARLKEGSSIVVKPHPIQTLEQIHGTFENDEAFQTAMRLGRQWREGQRPKVNKVKRR